MNTGLFRYAVDGDRQNPAKRGPIRFERLGADYEAFLDRKAHVGSSDGFEPSILPDFLFDFQRALVEWSVHQGRGAIFVDCGMGKTPMELVWAENVAAKTGGRVLILTPLAVSFQIVREAEKFGIGAMRNEGETRIIVTNYERLHHYRPEDFAAVVCDESSAIKAFDGKRRAEVTDFMRKARYRLLATATAAPNDYIELGTSSEALGYLGYMDMLARFFKNDQNTSKPVRRWTAHKTGFAAQTAGGDRGKWRFKGHAESHFWRWVASWARAMRKPSDLGFRDGRFVLPELIEREHIVGSTTPRGGTLFQMPAAGLWEEREELRHTIRERCEKAAEFSADSDQVIIWCHLNPEGDLLEKIIPDAVQVSGRDSDDVKETKLRDFAEGRTRVLITKPKIGAWGLNLQGCHRIVYFSSHSFESYYQAVRRCWRFGQTEPVSVDIITAKGCEGVRDNLRRKSEQADKMFGAVVAHMKDALGINRQVEFEKAEERPSWL